MTFLWPTTLNPVLARIAAAVALSGFDGKGSNLAGEGALALLKAHTKQLAHKLRSPQSSDPHELTEISEFQFGERTTN